jgi:hypothetical protein
MASLPDARGDYRDSDKPLPVSGGLSSALGCEPRACPCAPLRARNPRLVLRAHCAPD